MTGNAIHRAGEFDVRWRRSDGREFTDAAQPSNVGMSWTAPPGCVEVMEVITVGGGGGADSEPFGEETLHKVYGALLRAGLTGQQATDAISDMQNLGILFREAT